LRAMDSLVIILVDRLQYPVILPLSEHMVMILEFMAMMRAPRTYIKESCLIK